MAKPTSKILWCSHRKIFKVCLVIFQYYERKDQNKVFVSFLCQKIAIFNCNYEKNICRVFPLLAQFLLTKSERELDYYYQVVDI